MTGALKDKRYFLMEIIGFKNLNLCVSGHGMFSQKCFQKFLQLQKQIQLIQF